MDIRPISGAIGAEIYNIDIGGALSDVDIADVREAFFAYKVLVFREQTLTPSSQLKFSEVFGEPDVYPFIQGLPETPEVIEILKTENDTLNFGGSWHSDTAYLACPALGTALYALEVPSVGGDTLFTNTQRAFESLSSGMQQTLTGLVGVNSSELGYRGGRAAGMARLAGMKGTYVADSGGYEAEHPIVRTHPHTGNKALYVSRSHTARFCGMTAEESKPLIDYLATHITRPEFTCRVRWAPGTLTVWDNRTTQHSALNDYQGHRRRMHRVTLKGDRPF
jgi:taurine dioxygenase